jgi:hypothetical protein
MEKHNQNQPSPLSATPTIIIKHVQLLANRMNHVLGGSKAVSMDLAIRSGTIGDYPEGGREGVEHECMTRRGSLEEDYRCR